MGQPFHARPLRARTARRSRRRRSPPPRPGQGRTLNAGARPPAPRPVRRPPVTDLGGARHRAKAAHRPWMGATPAPTRVSWQTPPGSTGAPGSRLPAGSSPPILGSGPAPTPSLKRGGGVRRSAVGFFPLRVRRDRPLAARRRLDRHRHRPARSRQAPLRTEASTAPLPAAFASRAHPEPRRWRPGRTPRRPHTRGEGGRPGAYRRPPCLQGDTHSSANIRAPGWTKLGERNPKPLPGLHTFPGGLSCAPHTPATPLVAPESAWRPTAHTAMGQLPIERISVSRGPPDAQFPGVAPKPLHFAVCTLHTLRPTPAAESMRRARTALQRPKAARFGGANGVTHTTARLAFRAFAFYTPARRARCAQYQWLTLLAGTTHDPRTQSCAFSALQRPQCPLAGAAERGLLMVEQRAGWTPPRLGTREQRALSWLATVEPPSGIVLQPSPVDTRRAGLGVEGPPDQASGEASGGRRRSPCRVVRGAPGAAAAADATGAVRPCPGSDGELAAQAGAAVEAGCARARLLGSGTAGPKPARRRRSIGSGWRTAARFPGRGWLTCAGSAASRGRVSRAGSATRGPARRE